MLLLHLLSNIMLRLVQHDLGSQQVMLAIRLGTTSRKKFAEHYCGKSLFLFLLNGLSIFILLAGDLH